MFILFMVVSAPATPLDPSNSSHTDTVTTATVMLNRAAQVVFASDITTQPTTLYHDSATQYWERAIAYVETALESGELASLQDDAKASILIGMRQLASTPVPTCPHDIGESVVKMMGTVAYANWSDIGYPALQDISQAQRLELLQVAISFAADEIDNAKTVW